MASSVMLSFTEAAKKRKFETKNIIIAFLIELVKTKNAWFLPR
jgi:hypothetical protein